MAAGKATLRLETIRAPPRVATMKCYCSTLRFSSYPRNFRLRLIAAASLLLWTTATVPSQTTSPAKTTAILKPLADRAAAANSAVFIGVNEFREDASLQGLRFAVNDAIEQAHLFVVELQLIPPGNCFVAISGAPTSDAEPLRRRLKELNVRFVPADNTSIFKAIAEGSQIARRESDIFIVSASSHGFTEGDDAYIMPSNGLRSVLGGTGVALARIEELMEQSRAGHRLLLVDACQERILPAQRRAPDSALGGVMADAFAAAMQRPTGQAKLVACKAEQYSYEYQPPRGVGHGVFTAGVLAALRGGAAAGPDQLVRLGAVAEYANAWVEQWVDEQNRRFPSTARQQSPYFQGPERTRQMPLAVRASDLEGLLAGLEKLSQQGGAFDDSLYQRLKQAIEAEAWQASERQRVLQQCRLHLDGQLEADVLAAYLNTMLAQSPPSTSSPTTPDSRPADDLAGDEFSNSIGMRLRRIPPGVFGMGSSMSPEELSRRFNQADPSLFQDEVPQRLVQINQPFYMSEHEITIGQFEAFVAATNHRTTAELDSVAGGYGVDDDGATRRGSQFSWRSTGWDAGMNHPVVNVSYQDAVAFCEWLSRSEGRRYRLPTEAEWEYCCRASSDANFPTGDDVKSLRGSANLDPNLGLEEFQFTAPAMSLAANPFGLYDLTGNVQEWCLDWYDPQAYAAEGDLLVDPRGPDTGYQRIVRGASWNHGAVVARSACRSKLYPDEFRHSIGFRVVLEATAEAE